MLNYYKHCVIVCLFVTTSIVVCTVTMTPSFTITQTLHENSSEVAMSSRLTMTQSLQICNASTEVNATVSQRIESRCNSSFIFTDTSKVDKSVFGRKSISISAHDNQINTKSLRTKTATRTTTEALKRTATEALAYSASNVAANSATGKNKLVSNSALIQSSLTSLSNKKAEATTRSTATKIQMSISRKPTSASISKSEAKKSLRTNVHRASALATPSLSNGVRVSTSDKPMTSVGKVTDFAKSSVKRMNSNVSPTASSRTGITSTSLNATWSQWSGQCKHICCGQGWTQHYNVSRYCYRRIVSIKFKWIVGEAECKRDAHGYNTTSKRPCKNCNQCSAGATKQSSVLVLIVSLLAVIWQFLLLHV